MNKMRRCFNCGDEIGVYSDYEPLDTCGKLECEKAARDAMRQERDEAHEKLDIDRGWDRWR